MTPDPLDTTLKEQAILNRVYDDVLKALRVVLSSDIQIGAVEIKNSTDDTRATVTSKGLSVFDAVTNSLVPEVYDYVAITYPTTSSEVYTFKTGGSGGTTISTITLTYSDAVTKEILTSVAKT